MPIPQVKPTTEKPQEAGYMGQLRAQLTSLLMRVQQGEATEPIVEELRAIVYASYKAGKQSSRGKS